MASHVSQGLTAARIAAVCNVQPQNVTRALGGAKDREHGLEKEHLLDALEPA